METKFTQLQMVAVFHDGWKQGRFVGVIGSQIKDDKADVYLVDVDGKTIKALPSLVRDQVHLKYADHGAGVYVTETIPPNDAL